MKFWLLTFDPIIDIPISRKYFIYPPIIDISSVNFMSSKTFSGPPDIQTPFLCRELSIIAAGKTTQGNSPCQLLQTLPNITDPAKYYEICLSSQIFHVNGSDGRPNVMIAKLRAF